MKLGWKTLTGAVIWAVGTLVQPEVMGILPESIGTVVQTVGGLLGAVGVRHAIAKK